MMKFKKSKNPMLDSVDISKDCFGGWFIRVWHKDWLERIGKGQKEFGEGFWKNKFEAYRNAMNELIKPN